MSAPHVFFDLSGHAAALSLELVRGAHEPVPVSGLAGASDIVLGLATVEGRVLTVLDPRRLLSPTAEQGQTDLILVLDGEADGVALSLTLPVRVDVPGPVADGRRESPFRALGRRNCLAPDGRHATVIEVDCLMDLISSRET